VTRLGVIGSLLFVLIIGAAPATRPPFTRPRWSDTDRDCRSTRVETMAYCSEVTYDAAGCRALRVVCLDALTGHEFATDTVPQSVHIDHLYPASVAWKRKVWRRPDGTPCTSSARTRTDPGCPDYEEFYNETLNLVVTRARSNRRKSDLMPDRWCPGFASRVALSRRIQLVAKGYGLPLTGRELAALKLWESGKCMAGALDITTGEVVR
jgi:hypothetical protein